MLPVQIIASAVQELTGISLASIRETRGHIHGDRRAARALLHWLCVKLIPIGAELIGAATGFSKGVIYDDVRLIDRLRAVDPDYRQGVDAALETLLAIEQAGPLTFRMTADPVQAANRIMRNPAREAPRATIEEIEAMAAFIVQALAPEPAPAAPELEAQTLKEAVNG